MHAFSFARRLAPATATLTAAVCTGALVTGVHSQRDIATAAAEGNPEYSGGGARGTPRMIISDPDAFARKWKKFSTDGVDKLLVIADFDQTLTPYYKPNGAQEASSHGTLMTSSVLDAELVRRERDLFTRYFPIYMSPTMSQDEKLPFMIDWWTGSNDLLLEFKLTKQQIAQAVAQSDLSFRRGFHEILRLLTLERVPVLIFSAGLYDVIHAVLDKEFVASPERTTPSNVHVVSNMMTFDARGTITGFQGELIHSSNKNASVLLDTPFWQQCKLQQRRNVILLGDSRGDVAMVDGLDCAADEILRIGFLNTHVAESLDEYLALYDVVLTHDASLLPVEMLLHQLQSSNDS